MALTRHSDIFRNHPTSPDLNMSTEVAHSAASPLTTSSQLLPANTLVKSVTFLPPVVTPSGRSPLKAVSHSQHSLPKRHFDNISPILFPPSELAVFSTDSPSKRLHTSMSPTQSSQRASFTTFPTNKLADEENFTLIYHNDNIAEFPDPTNSNKTHTKRTLLEAAQLQERHHKKPRLEPRPEQRPALRKEESSTLQIPEPQDMPLVDDNGSKPPYSYASLIGMSILRSPARRLTLAQIYKWISDTFSYYRASEAGWQNSIRHNLSLNKAFIKQERPKDDPGKGNYWAIEPGMEQQFIRDKPTRRPTSSSGPSASSGIGMKVISQLSSEANLGAWQSHSIPATKSNVRIFNASEPSSDATIPASDAPSYEDDFYETRNMAPPSQFPHSSPLQLIHSSPPVALLPQTEKGTTPIALDFPLSSIRSTSRKRKLTSMDDSGYFSSLNSSASRPHDASNVPQNEVNLDGKRIKRGRAEEEIARIRSSSHDISPIKGSSFLTRPISHLVSSSPLRHFDSSVMLPPLTPAVTFKIPPKPPASISPNTNLRNHRNKIRELVGSPVKTLSLHDEIPFSPAFKILDDECSTFNEDFGPTFDIFVDTENVELDCSSISPKKSSVRRPRLERASKSTNILADVTGNILSSKIFDTDLNSPFLNSPTRQKTCKLNNALDNTLNDLPKEDIFGLDLFTDEEPDDFGGLDILQGFQKIGGNKNSLLSSKKALKPLLGTRSNTSCF